MVATTAAWMEVTNTKASITASVSFKTIVWAHPPILREIPKQTQKPPAASSQPTAAASKAAGAELKMCNCF